MVQSEKYYMITINQSPECIVPYNEVKEKLLKLAKGIASRWLLAEEEGSINGKAHFHLSLELDKEMRKDNLRRKILNATQILKTKTCLDIAGTRKVPHKPTWELYAIDYVVKDLKYETNIDEEYIQERINEKQLKDKVDQKSIYIDKPKFWKLYREELMKFEGRFGTYETDTIRHMIMEVILGTYTPLWLKPHIIAAIIDYQEGLDNYEYRLESLVNSELFGKIKALEVSISK